MSRSKSCERVALHREVSSILKNDLKQSNEYRFNKTNEIEVQSFENQLRNWSIEFKITHRAIGALLKILVSTGMWKHTSDSRTLLKTPHSTVISEKAGGKFWYLGIQKNIEWIFSNVNKSICIQLIFNIDGLPLFQSSKSQFWPILARIHGKLKFRNTISFQYFLLNKVSLLLGMDDIAPFIVSIWCGDSKPKNINEFLEPFVKELKTIMEKGVYVNNNLINIFVRCFVCDTPARSLIKGKVNIIL